MHFFCNLDVLESNTMYFYFHHFNKKYIENSYYISVSKKVAFHWEAKYGNCNTHTTHCNGRNAREYWDEKSSPSSQNQCEHKK